MDRHVGELIRGVDRLVGELVEYSNDGGGPIVADGQSVGGQTSVGPIQVGSAPPTTLYVYWETLHPGVVEGGTATLIATLSRAIAIPSRIEVTVQPTSTADPSHYTLSTQELVFPAGATEAFLEVETTDAAAQGATTQLDLLLDPDGEILQGDPDGPVVLATNPDVDNSEARLLITDNQTGGTPVYRFSNDGTQVDLVEGQGGYGFDLVLDQEAPEDITIVVGVTSAAGATEAVHGEDWTFEGQGAEAVCSFLGPQGSIPGDTTFPIVLVPLLSSVPRVADAELTVEVKEVLQGTVAAGSPVSFDVVIEDVNSNEGPPVVAFGTNAADLAEGATRRIYARLTDSTGEPTMFGQATNIDITRTFSDPNLNDFSDNLGATPQLQFGPSDTEAFIDVTALADGDLEENETVTYTIPADGTTYNTPGGGANSVTITKKPSTTQLQLQEVTGIGGTRIVYGLLGVPSAPASSLPSFTLDGNAVQVVAMDFNTDLGGFDNSYTSCFFYGVLGEDGSVVDTPSAITIALDDEGTGATPAISGDFTDYPELVFQADYANTANTFECRTEPTPGSADGIIWQDDQWTGASSTRFPQASGPELVEQQATLMRLIDSTLDETSTAANTTSASGNACGLVDVCITRYAGDDEVFLVEGSWRNGAMKADEDPYNESDWVDSEVYMLEFTVQAAGYDVVAAFEHPSEGDRAASVYSLLNRRAEDYYFRGGDEYTFRFAMVATGAPATATARAESYLRYESAAFPVGPLGSTHNPIQGIDGQYTLNLRDFVNAGPGPDGYDGINRVGDDNVADDIARWESGANFRDMSNNNDRSGWWMPAGPPLGGGQGTSGKWPYSLPIPHHSVLLKNWFFHHSATQSQRMGIRDVTTGDAGWWWVMSQDFGSGHRAPVLSSPFFTRSALNRPYWFAHFYMAGDSATQWNGADANDFIIDTNAGINSRTLNSFSRPWRIAEVDDPARASITGAIQDYQDRAGSHFSHIRKGFNELWWNARSYVAYRTGEDWAAWITRMYPPQIPQDGFKSDRPRCALENIFANMVSGPENTGEWWVSNEGNNGRIELGGARTLAWPLHFIAGFYGIADRDTKLALRGRGAATGKGGPELNGDCIGGMFDLFEYAMSPAGIVGRNTSNNGSPDPFSENHFGVVSRPNRDGALPQPVGPSASLPASAVSFEFQLGYSVGALRACKLKVFGPTEARQTAADRLFECQDAYAEGARTYSTGFHEVQIPYVMPLGFGSQPAGYFDPSGQTPNIPPDVATLAEVRAGAANEATSTYWLQSRVGNSEISFGHNLHANKSGWHAGFGYEALGNDDDLLDHFKRVYGIEDLDDQDAFDYFFRPDGGSGHSGFGTNSFCGLISSPTSGNRQKLYSNSQYWCAALCALQRRLGV